MHIAGLEAIAVGEDLLCERTVRHVLLYAEIVDGKTKMERGSHGYRPEIGGTVTAGTDVIERSEVGDLFHVADATAVDDAHADIVDPLAPNQIVRIPHRVEDFPDGKRRGGVLADEREALL